MQVFSGKSKGGEGNGQRPEGGEGGTLEKDIGQVTVSGRAHVHIGDTNPTTTDNYYAST